MQGLTVQMPYDLVKGGHSGEMPQQEHSSSGYAVYLNFENKAVIFGSVFKKKIERETGMSLEEFLEHKFCGKTYKKYVAQTHYQARINGNVTVSRKETIWIFLWKENLAHATKFFRMFKSGDDEFPADEEMKK